MTTTARMTAAAQATGLQRLLIRLDGALCAALGLGLALGAGPIGTLAGVDAPAVIAGLGAGTALWGAFLLYSAAQPWFDRRLVAVAAVANVIWVLGSIALLFGAGLPLTPIGFWGIAAQADTVALLALAQFYALRR